MPAHGKRLQLMLNQRKKRFKARVSVRSSSLTGIIPRSSTPQDARRCQNDWQNLSNARSSSGDCCGDCSTAAGDDDADADAATPSLCDGVFFSTSESSSLCNWSTVAVGLDIAGAAMTYTFTPARQPGPSYAKIQRLSGIRKQFKLQREEKWRVLIGTKRNERGKQNQ